MNCKEREMLFICLETILSQESINYISSLSKNILFLILLGMVYPLSSGEYLNFVQLLHTGCRTKPHPDKTPPGQNPTFFTTTDNTPPAKIVPRTKPHPYIFGCCFRRHFALYIMLHDIVFIYLTNY